MNDQLFATKIDELVTAIEDTKDFYTEVNFPADAAASATWEQPIFKAPFACNVEDVVVVPASTIGQATNFMTLDVQNKGAAGTETTSVGSRACNATNTITGMVGVDLVSTDSAVSSGHVLSLKKTVTASGQAFPGGLVRVKYSRA